MWLPRLTFALTNTVLNSLQINKKNIEVEQLFTMETACQIRTKMNKFFIPKQHMRLQKAKVKKI